MLFTRGPSPGGTLSLVSLCTYRLPKSSKKNQQAMKPAKPAGMSASQAATVIQKAVKAAVGNGLRAAGGAAGAYAGSALGMPKKGAKIGHGVAAKLSRLIGTGDYTTNEGSVSVNSLFGRTGQTAGTQGSFESSNGGIRIKHREYIQDVFTSTTAGSAFTVSSWAVNPGLGYVFPYLAQIAANFEQYKFHGLVFEFVSSTAPYGVTSLGTYVMAMEYNAAAPLFLTKPQMENSDYALSCRLDHSGMYGVECAIGSQAQTYYYVRAPGTTTPANLTDTGIMQLGIATTTVAAGAGIIAGSTIGELWVTYDVELIRPRISNARYGYAHLRGNATTSALPFGPVANQTLTSYGAMTGMTVSTNALTFPNASIGDVYMIQVSMNGAATLGATIPAPVTTNLTQFNIMSSAVAASAQYFAGGTTAATSSALSLTYFFTVNAEQPAIPSFTLPIGATLVVPPGFVDVLVIDMGNGFSTSGL